MKTTVVSPSGRAEAWRVSDDGVLLTISEACQGGANVAIALDKHALYVLGHALVNLAMTMEAEEGGYELCGKVSGRIACTFRKGTKCPDCGPAQHEKACAHRFMNFGDQTKRRCADCNLIEPLGTLCTVMLPTHSKVESVTVSGVRCHGDACAFGQVECPHKAACGVA